MRKLIGLGLTAVTSATMAFGTVGSTPAHAAVAPPGSLVGQVCAVLPNQLSGLTTLLGTLGASQSNAATDLAAKQATFATAQSDFITAFVDYLKTVDSGGSVTAKGIIVNDKLSVYSDKAAAWVNAWNAKDFADRQVAVNGISQSMLTQMEGLLGGCV